MIKQGIRIGWLNGEEYIELDLNNLQALGDIRETREWWVHDRKAVKYNTTSEVRQLGNKQVELKLHYIRDDNRHLNPNEVSWGISTIVLTPGAASGTAHWRDDQYSDSNGPAPWVAIKPGLFKKGKRIATTKIEREQQKFRGMLLTESGACALTGEEMADVLEAAHIIPSCERGAEKIENGILLRADIHRLMDCGKFRLNPDGQVVQIKDVSPYYQQLLEGKRLDQRTRIRVREALEYEWQRKRN